ncbi:paramyosin-like isoform X1 [Clytia hemisphaerica]|uniref:Uncharacterized protein n=1 Tax=Clytia hemisphaerica TaxID=252671 RepID=A0A7M5V6M2_9CNID
MVKDRPPLPSKNIMEDDAMYASIQDMKISPRRSTGNPGKTKSQKTSNFEIPTNSTRNNKSSKTEHDNASPRRSSKGVGKNQYLTTDKNNNRSFQRLNDIALNDDPISEGEVVMQQRQLQTPDNELLSTNTSLVYASNESLDRDYLADRAKSMEDLYATVNKRNLKSPINNTNQNLITSLNSTITASNFITSEKLMEKLEKSKKNQNTTHYHQQLNNSDSKPRKSALKKSPRNQQQPTKRQLDLNDQSSQTFVSNQVFSNTSPRRTPDRSPERSPSRDSYTQVNIPFTTFDITSNKAPRKANSSHNTSFDTEHLFNHQQPSESPRHQPNNTSSKVEEYDNLHQSYLFYLSKAVDTLSLMMSVAYSPHHRLNGIKNMKVIRGIIRDNEILQEQLVDSSTVAAPSTIIDDPPSALMENSKLDQIRQPYYNQVLQKRIQTLDADREVLRQLNKALVEENQNLKLKNQSQINKSQDLNDSSSPRPRDAKTSTPTIQTSFYAQTPQDSKMKNEIEALKNQVTSLNEDLLDYKKQSVLATETLNGSYMEPTLNLYNKRSLSPAFPILRRSGKGTVPYEQWESLCEQSKLVLEENQLLSDQKALYKKTINDLSTNYQAEVSRLTAKLNSATRHKKTVEQELSEKECELTLLQDRYANLNERVERSVEIVEHETKLERIHKNYMNEINNLKVDIDDLSSKLEAVNTEKSKLAIQVTDLTATNSRLTLELKLADKNLRRSDKRLHYCMNELQTLAQQESTTKGTLSEVLKLAEKTALEKQQMAVMVESQREKTQDALHQIHKDDATLQQLRRELKNTKERRKNQFGKIKQHIVDQEEEVSGIITQYQDELKGLRNVVREKQRFIEKMQTDKEMTELRLDEMWNSLHPPYKTIRGYDGRR